MITHPLPQFTMVLGSKNTSYRNAISERDLDKQPIVFEKKGGKIFLRDSEKDMGRVQDEFLGPYDKVINCLGFDVSVCKFYCVYNFCERFNFICKLAVKAVLQVSS